MIPLDYDVNGQIRDDDIKRMLVIPMQAGVFVTSVMDCCHSGSVCDLPYVFKADGEHENMEEQEGYDFGSAMNILNSISAGDVAAAATVIAAADECCVVS